MKVTIKDVAKKANVSEATVSRVMSNKGCISEETKKRVLRVVKELDYYPNSAAISLTKSSSNIIGVVVEGHNTDPLHNDFFIEMLSNVCKFANEKGYYILYVNFVDEDNEENVKKLIKTNRIDGLIFLNLYENSKYTEVLESYHIPCVVIGKPKTLSKNMGWVDNDNEGITYQITKKYLDEGKKNIAFLSGPIDLTVSNYRKKGYLKALNEANIPIKEEYILSSEFDRDAAYNLVDKFLEQHIVDAIVTTDDILAIGSLEAIKDKGLDIVVTGFNNSKLKNYLKYDFLTVDINYMELSKASINLLINKMQKKNNVVDNVMVESQIIEN